MEADQSKKRLKGVYLVPDPLMMKPHFGPSEHIRVGLNELSRYFDMELLVLGDNSFAENGGRKTSITKGFATANGFVGLLRDLKLYSTSNRNVEHLLTRLKEMRVDFIYERGQYL